MELYVARQPIFDVTKSIIAYELLHREASDFNAYQAIDDDYATSSVLTSSFLSLGLDTLTEGKKAFVNFTETLLTQGIPTLLPNEQLGIEISQDISLLPGVFDACTLLKNAGYTIALDNYSLRNSSSELINLADIIKIDVQTIPANEQTQIMTASRNKKIKFLAKMVENEQEFDTAFHRGYSLFQGYFFAHPVIYSTSTIPVSKLGYIQLIRAVNEERPDFRSIIVAIENDVAMSLETIKLVNSAYFARRYKIYSVKQAIVTLGIEGVRKWVTLSTLTKIGKNKPDVLISTSLIRSKFMELIAKQLGQSRRSAEFSMLGLFSLLDALTGCSFDSILSRLNISAEIKSTLINGQDDSTLGMAYLLMLTYERGKWEKASVIAGSLGITLEDVASIYVSSLRWYNDTIWMSNSIDEQA